MASKPLLLEAPQSGVCILAGHPGKGWSLRLQGFVSDALSDEITQVLELHREINVVDDDVVWHL